MEVPCRISYSVVSYLFVNCSGSNTSVEEEIALRSSELLTTYRTRRHIKYHVCVIYNPLHLFSRREYVRYV